MSDTDSEMAQSAQPKQSAAIADTYDPDAETKDSITGAASTLYHHVMLLQNEKALVEEFATKDTNIIQAGAMEIMWATVTEMAKALHNKPGINVEQSRKLVELYNYSKAAYNSPKLDCRPEAVKKAGKQIAKWDTDKIVRERNNLDRQNNIARQNLKKGLTSASGDIREDPELIKAMNMVKLVAEADKEQAVEYASAWAGHVPASDGNRDRQSAGVVGALGVGSGAAVDDSRPRGLG